MDIHNILDAVIIFLCCIIIYGVRSRTKSDRKGDVERGAGRQAEKGENERTEEKQEKRSDDEQKNQEEETDKKGKHNKEKE